MADSRESQILLADEESPPADADGQRANLTSRLLYAFLVAAVATLAVCIVAPACLHSSARQESSPMLLCAGQRCYPASAGRLAVTQLLESDVPKGACPRSSGFCQKEDDHLEYHDCDGDGILDPYCSSGELLKFGFLSSADGCRSNWPNGFCQKQDEPSYVASLRVIPSPSNEITIIHFNDVYQVAGVFERGVRKGGMSRAAYTIEHARKRNPDRTFVVFAGDLLSPSVLSDLFEGAQMVDILNYLNLTAASLGNHEFDFGVDTLKKRIHESEFPWLNTNLLDEKGELFPGRKVIRGHIRY